MKPTMANLKKVALGLTDPHELSLLKDNVAFYIAGVRAGAEEPKKREILLEDARFAEVFISDRIEALKKA